MISKHILSLSGSGSPSPLHPPVCRHETHPPPAAPDPSSARRAASSALSLASSTALTASSSAFFFRYASRSTDSFASATFFSASIASCAAFFSASVTLRVASSLSHSAFLVAACAANCLAFSRPALTSLTRRAASARAVAPASMQLLLQPAPLACSSVPSQQSQMPSLTTDART